MMNLLPSCVAASFRSQGLGARLLRPLVNRLVTGRPTRIVVRSGPGKGLRLLIDPASEKYYWTGTHERPVQEAISTLLKPGMTFWDVGAHIGFFSCLGSRAVGASGHVHAFEPVPGSRERLRASIAMNALRNVTVHDVALAEASGHAPLHARGSSVKWSLVPDGAEGEKLPVRCCTLDEMAGSVHPPHLIKVDVEGAEVDVLRGGLGLLATARPSIIVEFSSEALVAEARDLLRSHAFERLAPHHWLLR